MTEDRSIVTLKELAYGAIAKHSRKVFKYKAKVLEDRDPEDLHQMRVEMRRLRSSISLTAWLRDDGFAVAVDLLAIVNEKIEQIPEILISKQMPQLAKLLLKTRYQKWLEWQNLQRQFLDE